MTADIRTKVVSSVGPIISGSISDSYIQGQGLIFTRGNIEIVGQKYLSTGTGVDIAYTEGNRLIRLPRTLFVISCSVDIYRNKTALSLGCLLTLRREGAVPETTIRAAETVPEDIPCRVFRKANLGIPARDIADRILNLLDIPGDSPNLENHFSVDEFVIPSQPLDILGQLLVSEGFVGFTTISGFSTKDNRPRKGPRISPESIIDVSPINSGDIPGETVIVKYSTIKLGLPADEEDEDEAEAAKRNWEWEESFGPLQPVSISYIDELAVPEPNEVVVNANYIPYSFTATTYDQWDRAVNRISYQLSVLAETNNRYATDLYRYKTLGPQALIVPTSKVQFTSWKYKVPSKGGTSNVDLLNLIQSSGVGGIKGSLKAIDNADEEKTALQCLEEETTPDDLDIIESEATYSYISEAELAGTLSLDSYSYQLADFSTLRDVVNLQTSTTILESVSFVQYEKDEASGITKTKTQQSLIYGKTATGQQDLAKIIKENQDNLEEIEIVAWLNDALNKAQQLRNVGLEVRIRTEREFGIQKRPTQAQRNETYYRKIPATGTPESVLEFAGSYGANTIEFQLPYADDDKITWTSTEGYKSEPSKAQERAVKYGKIQNWMLFGNRNGLSVQMLASAMPPGPYQGIRLILPEDASLSINYMTNGVTYTFDQNGIIASADLMIA